MSPSTGRGFAGFETLDVFEQCRDVVPRTNVAKRHSQEFVARIAVMLDCGAIDFEESQGLAVEDPRWLGILFEQSAVAFLRIEQRFLDTNAFPDFTLKLSCALSDALLQRLVQLPKLLFDALSSRDVLQHRDVMMRLALFVAN